jgi:hypothetical protein
MMNEILVKLLTSRVVRLGEGSWRWAERKPGNPSLKNAVTSRMFRADLVEVVDGEMQLTAMGRIIAEELTGIKE